MLLEMPSVKRNQLLIFVVLLFIPHFIFNALNYNIWPWDQSWYAEQTYRSVLILFTDPLHYLQHLVHLFGFKAPLIAWVSQIWVPWAWLTNDPNALVLTSVMASAGSLLFLGFAFERAFPSYVALLCLASFSLYFSITREFFVEPLQMLSVSWFIYLFYKRHALSFGTLLISALTAGFFAMAAKVSSPVYIVFWSLPILAELVHKMKAKEVLNFPSRSKICLAAVFVGLVLTWYAINLKTLLEFMRSASSGQIALLYGNASPFGAKFGFWLDRLIDETVGNRYRDVALTVFWLLMIAQYKRLLRVKILLPWFQIVLVLLVFCFQINEETRYLLPLFPTIAALLYELLCDQRYLTYAAMTVATLHFGELNLASLHLIERKGQTNWPSLYKYEAERRQQIDQVIDFVCKSQQPVGAVGVDTMDLNYLIFSQYIAFRRELWGSPCTFHTLGYAPQSIDDAWKYVMSFKPKYFVTYKFDRLVQIFQHGDFFNKTAFAAYIRIKESPDWEPSAIKLSDWEVFEKVVSHPDAGL